ncbi:MAG: hypothetical protein VX519_05810 [Myxococcota bacterium]|nr:hypothetical protein [Myxococcota bacterium]
MRLLKPTLGSSPSGSLPRPRLRRVGFYLVLYSCLQTLRAFQNHNLGSLTVLFFVLLGFSVFLYLINAVAPVAPFVYSLI